MNKTLGLILTSVFLLSTLGIITGFIIPTQAANSNDAAIYTIPSTTSVTSTSNIVINLFLNSTSNATIAAQATGFNYGLAINYTLNAIQFTLVVPKGTSYKSYGPIVLGAKNYEEYGYFDLAHNSVVLLLNTTNFSKELAYSYEQSIGVTPSASYKIYNYINKSVSVNQYMNELSLPSLISKATGGEYNSLAKLPAGTELEFTYAGVTYTITISPTVKLVGTLLNPLYYANSKMLPGANYAVGRSNITVAVYDNFITTTTSPFNFTLTYSSLAPALIYWFVIANTTPPQSGVPTPTANFQAPPFKQYFPPPNSTKSNSTISNSTILYSAAPTKSSILMFNGQMNVTANENVTLTLQTGTNIFTSPKFNVTPPGKYTFSGRLGVGFNAYIYQNGSASLAVNIFNGTINFFFNSTEQKASFTFFLAPIIPIGDYNGTTVIYNGVSIKTGFPQVVLMFNITGNFNKTSSSGGNYIIYGSVKEAQLYPNPSTLANATNSADFVTDLISASMKTLVSSNYGESTTTLTGTSLSFTVLMPLEFIVESFGYIYLVTFHIWGPSTTVTVTGVDYYHIPILLGSFRAYIALPSFFTVPKTPLVGLTCDNMYTLAQISDAGSVLQTSTANSNTSIPTVMGPYDLMSNAGLHVAIYNGTKLIKSETVGNKTVGPLPNATTAPITTTVTLNGQTVALTYSSPPTGYYPVDFKFEPGFGYTVTTNVIYNTSTPTYVITVYMPLKYILNTKIVIGYVSPDYAAFYYYSSTGQYQTNNVTLTFANVTPELVMPQVFPVGKLYMPFGIYDPYYVFYSSISIGPQSGVIEAIENGFNVGNITAITVQLSGMNESIVLSPLNVSKLLVSPNLGEVSQCSPLFETTLFNISALASLLGLPNPAALNGSYLYVTYHDVISGAYVTNKTLLVVGQFYVMPPTTPGSVEWILTAKYINATTGIPVEISYAVVQQPSAKVLDINAANASITQIQVTGVKIVSKYATVTVMYNPSNASTIVYMNGMFVASYGGNLISTLSQTSTYGVYYGPVVNLYVAAGSLSSPNGTMYIILGSHKVSVGTANLYTYAGYHFGPYSALPLASNVTFTVQDPVTTATVSGQTTLGAFNNTPIRLAPLGVSIPQTAQYKVFYYYSTPLVLSPTSQYIVLSATSVIPYPYPFYIETESFLGYNVTTGTPVPGTPAFQTVYSPSLGPGVVLQVPVQSYQFISLSSPSEPHTVVMFAVPFAGGPAISLYPTFLVYTNVTAVSS
ncbi:hypothetical protein [Saccharolobus islandicus]|uniref:Glycosylated S-layer protein, SlaA n=1 Tax=Saccharolobus islandicus (strain L.D.8.5 / Lassen \|nr:hypothetical protein [Sulfolobus islandicus]ADB87627.1 hypothetical protein LD85_1972 [Sulfolobus islandicus L.D.8.5]